MRNHRTVKADEIYFCGNNIYIIENINAEFKKHEVIIVDDGLFQWKYVVVGQKGTNLFVYRV